MSWRNFQSKISLLAEMMVIGINSFQNKIFSDCYCETASDIMCTIFYRMIGDWCITLSWYLKVFLTQSNIVKILSYMPLNPFLFLSVRIHYKDQCTFYRYFHLKENEKKLNILPISNCHKIVMVLAVNRKMKILNVLQ